MKAPQGVLSDEQIIEQYLDQPGRLPDSVRRRVESSWDGEPVMLYALADLDDDMRLARQWVLLGPTRVCVTDETQTGPLAAFQRSGVKSVRESPGLSCTVLTVEGEANRVLARIRYTHRQKHAFEPIRYVLEQDGKGERVEPEHGDKVYIEATTQPVKEAQASFANSKLSVVTRLLSYLRPYRVRVVFGMLAAVGMTLFALAPPWVTGRLIDGVIRPFQRGELAFDAARGKAWVLLGVIAGTYLLLEFCAWIRLRTMAVLGELVAQDLRNELYRHLQTLSLGYFSRKRTGSLISRVSSDTDRLWDFIAFGVVEVSLSVIRLLGLGVVLMLIDWQLGLLMMIPVPIMLWVIARHGADMQKYFLRAWQKWSRLTDVLSDTIPGMRVVKAFSQEGYETGRFVERNDRVVSEFNRIHSVWTSFWPRLALSMHCLVVLVWLLALPRVLHPQDPTLTVGAFVSVLLYMGMFFQPIETIGQMARMVNRATSSAHRIFEVLDTEPDTTDRENPHTLDPVEGRIEFQDVGFSYDGVRPVISGMSFTVEPGEMIGLVGPSGAGKTTLINLIARFYDATSGSILVDGVDVRDLDSGHYRRQIGMVLQDPYLFHGTVLDNIRYGWMEASRADVVAAARAANAHDFICKLSNGYDTFVGERGHTLSGGERQRVSIARAILTNPRILILDEATSSVDTETERNIQEALDRLVRGRTVFAIAHRLSTLTRADRLICLKDGRIEEVGTHAELLAKEDGLYRKLHDMQQQLHEYYAV